MKLTEYEKNLIVRTIQIIAAVVMIAGIISLIAMLGGAK